MTHREIQPAFVECEKTGSGQIRVAGHPSFASEPPAGNSVFGQEIDRAFGGWEWDGQRLRVWNDRYGLFPLFVGSRPGRISVATSLCDFPDRQAFAEFDYPALAVLLRLGHFLGDDTAFTGIRRLPPGSTLVWDGQVHLHRSAIGDTLNDRYSREQALSEYDRRFAASIRMESDRHRPCGPLVVPLSGGADSRHILLECRRQKVPVSTTFTLDTGRANREDRTIARRLAERASVFNEQPRPAGAETRIPDEVLKNRLCHFSTLDHGWFVAGRRYLETRDRPWVFDGLAGDVLSAGHRLVQQHSELAQTGQWSALAERLLPADEVFLRTILRQSFLKKIPRSLAIERMQRELATLRDVHNPMVRFAFFNRTRRSIAMQTLGVLQGVANVSHPFLQKDVFDFLIGLPESWFWDQTFHAEVIASAYPEFSDIPYAGKSAGALDYEKNLKFSLVFARGMMRGRGRSVLRRGPVALRSVAKGLAGRTTGAYLRPMMLMRQIEELQDFSGASAAPTSKGPAGEVREDCATGESSAETTAADRGGPR